MLKTASFISSYVTDTKWHKHFLRLTRCPYWTTFTINIYSKIAIIHISHIILEWKVIAQWNQGQAGPVTVGWPISTSHVMTQKYLIILPWCAHLKWHWHSLQFTVQVFMKMFEYEHGMTNKGCGSKFVYFQRIASLWRYTNLLPYPLTCIILSCSWEIVPIISKQRWKHDFYHDIRCKTKLGSGPFINPSKGWLTYDPCKHLHVMNICKCHSMFAIAT